MNSKRACLRLKNVGAPKVSSRLAPFRALNIRCSLKEKDESRIETRFQISHFIMIRIPNRE